MAQYWYENANKNVTCALNIILLMKEGKHAVPLNLPLRKQSRLHH